MAAYQRMRLASQPKMAVYPFMKRSILTCVTLTFLASCTNTDSHLPNPITLPAYALNSALNNAFYNARRNRVESYVAVNQALIIADTQSGNGPFLRQAMSLARVRPAKQSELISEIQRGYSLYSQDAEALVAALMVHGDPRIDRS